MKFIKYKLILIVFCIWYGYLYLNQLGANTLDSISIQNNIDQSIITLNCKVAPVYTVFSLHNPERIVIDILKISKICNNKIFPIKFTGDNIITGIRSSFSEANQSVRIVCDIHCEFIITTVIQKKIEQNFCVILKISRKMVTVFNNPSDIFNMRSVIGRNTTCYKQSENLQEKIIKNKVSIRKNTNYNYKTRAPIVVAIDAGHGGQDPGATGFRGIYEKHITFGIAEKFKKILDTDPMFKAVMIRDGDYFLSVTERSDLARKKRANVLISIHVDSSLNSRVRGASVWVLSNRRVKTETINWLRSHKDKHAELLGGLGDVLINYRDDPYFNHLVLDLQFSYAQRESYNIAMKILNELKNISFLHKNAPEYSSFGVLRSPDIPSVLVETGFISNAKEAGLLKTNVYQEKIARALYKGLRSYLLESQKKL